MKHDWKLIWFKALVEEGRPVNLYQCQKCKNVLMDTEEHIEIGDRTECLADKKREK